MQFITPVQALDLAVAYHAWHDAVHNETHGPDRDASIVIWGNMLIQSIRLTRVDMDTAVVQSIVDNARRRTEQRERFEMSEADRVEHERQRDYWASPEGKAHEAKLEAMEPYDRNPHGEARERTPLVGND